jgi:hypothetical protein
MHHLVVAPRITFPVDDVIPATTPLLECRTDEAFGRTVFGGIEFGRVERVESSSDDGGPVVQGARYQPVLAAVHTAFRDHRPLVLTPDAVWITIAQGVAHHMAVEGERLRSRFVAHPGRLELVFENDWPDGTPEHPWPEAFAAWSRQIRDHVGRDVHDALVCEFSTTGPVDRAVSDIVMLDVFERYFEYVSYTICGIPTVTLEGTPEDWTLLAEKAAALAVFELDWWLAHLLPVCNQFVRASRGDVDLPHWQNACKLKENYGGDIINGWVAALFPYLRVCADGPCSRRNPIFETGEGFSTLAAPPGLSYVPFTWRNGRTHRERSMEAIGGLVGLTQDRETLAVRPKVGWAVRGRDSVA